MKLGAFRTLAAKAWGSISAVHRLTARSWMMLALRCLFRPVPVGKTSGLALLTLEAIFVHGFPADSIVATTFTRKAADEVAIEDHARRDEHGGFDGAPY